MIGSTTRCGFSAGSFWHLTLHKEEDTGTHTHTDRGGRHSELQDGGKEKQKWQVQPARTEEPLTIVTTIIIA